MAYIVIRLVPESPVDGGTFATYLDDLRLQLFDAYTEKPLSDFVYSSGCARIPSGSHLTEILVLICSAFPR